MIANDLAYLRKRISWHHCIHDESHLFYLPEASLIKKTNNRLRLFFVPTTSGGFRKVGNLEFRQCMPKKVADRRKYLIDEFTVG